METHVQQSLEGRHIGQHSRNPRDVRPASGRARSRSTAASWYRWFAVVGLVAVLSIVFAYRDKIPILTTSSGTNVPLLGSSVKSESDLAAVTSDFGRMPIVRVYYPGLPDPDAWTTGLAGANRSAVIVSFKALPTTILSGADDAALKHFFGTAPSGHPIYYSYYHEPEDNIGAGQFRLSDYKAAWARVVAIARAAHNPYLHSTLILMNWDLIPASHRSWKDYLPGGGIISTLGWDAYPVGSAENVNPQLTPPSDFMSPAIAASKSVGLPYGFPEFGLSTPSGRPSWLTEVGKYIMSSGALFASYFDGNAQYPTLRLTDSASIAVWRGFVAESRAGGPAPVSLAAQADATLRFQLSARANVTVCVLNANGRVVRTVARPGSRAGLVTFRYLVYQRVGHGLAAGHYTVLVVASNATGSASAAGRLSVS